jgi:hypothetical protein|tara:strand:- start:361 stop:750 length:390 start_codon:yes stop_codon:yes gene_type:complete
MSKFLKLVQENTPGEHAGKGPYTVEYKDMQGNVMAKLTVPDDVGSSYENFLHFAKVVNGDLEVASEQPVEDAEADMKDSVKAITAIANLPDQGVMGQLTSSTARKLQMAKRKMSSAALNIAKKFEQASK